MKKLFNKYSIKLLLLSIFLFSSLPYLAEAGGKSVRVNGYFKSNGTYVQPHYRSSPDKSVNNNWSTKGNFNPYTGKQGTKPTQNNFYKSNSSKIKFK